MAELSGGETAGIVIGSLIGGIIIIGLLLFLLRKWLRGPTKGSDVNVNLDNKVVVITGKIYQPFHLDFQLKDTYETINELISDESIL